MAYVFLNDGGPEAEEYDSNYYYFDESNPEAVAAVERMLMSKTPRNSAFKSEFNRICRASYERPAPVRRRSARRNWVSGIFGFFFNAMGANG